MVWLSCINHISHFADRVCLQRPMDTITRIFWRQMQPAFSSLCCHFLKWIYRVHVYSNVFTVVKTCIRKSVGLRPLKSEPERKLPPLFLLDWIVTGQVLAFVSKFRTSWLRLKCCEVQHGIGVSKSSFFSADLKKFTQIYIVSLI